MFFRFVAENKSGILIFFAFLILVKLVSRNSLLHFDFIIAFDLFYRFSGHIDTAYRGGIALLNENLYCREGENKSKANYVRIFFPTINGKND